MITVFHVRLNKLSQTGVAVCELYSWGGGGGAGVRVIFQGSQSEAGLCGRALSLRLSNYTNRASSALTHNL